MMIPPAIVGFADDTMHATRANALVKNLLVNFPQNSSILKSIVTPFIILMMGFESKP
jgi:hypothetical protein